MLLKKNIKLFYSKVHVKHLPIPANVTNQDFDGKHAGMLPDLVIVCLVSYENFGGHYNENRFNFRLFKVNLIEIVRKLECECPDMATPQYKK